MSTPRPGKSELEATNVVDLLIKLVQDTSWAQLYRDQIGTLCTKSNKTIYQLLAEHYGSSTAVNTAGRLRLITSVDDRVPNFLEVCDTLARNWDFIDPKPKDNGGMKMHPEEARDFCASQKYKGESYESLSESGQRTYWMICDAYRRSVYKGETNGR